MREFRFMLYIQLRRKLHVGIVGNMTLSYQTCWSRDNDIDLYLGGVWFKSEQGYWLS
jgi:hypothetical protein